MGLKLNGTKTSQLKELSLSGINVSKENIAAAVLRIEQFAYQTVLQKINLTSSADLIDRSKNKECAITFMSIYTSIFADEITRSFLIENKDRINEILSDLEESFDKTIIFKMMLSNALIHFTGDTLTVYQVIKEYLDKFYRTHIFDNQREFIENGACQMLWKEILKFRFLKSFYNFNKKAKTEFIKAKTRQVCSKKLISDEEINFMLDEFLSKITSLIKNDFLRRGGVEYPLKGSDSTYLDEIIKDFLNNFKNSFFQANYEN